MRKTRFIWLKLTVFTSLFLGCDSKSADSYRHIQNISNPINKFALLKSLTLIDPNFAQAKIDLGEFYLNQGKLDSASSLLIQAIEILKNRRANELKELNWKSSLFNAYQKLARILLTEASQDIYESVNQIDEKYSRIKKFHDEAVYYSPSLADVSIFKDSMDRSSFIKNNIFPFKLPYAKYVGLKDIEIEEAFKGCKRVPKKGTFEMAGIKIVYNYYLQYGTCLIHNTWEGQEYTDCIQFYILNGKCISLRVLPGYKLIRTSYPSIKSAEVLKDYLLFPLVEIGLKTEKSLPYDFYRQWISSYKSKHGFDVEFTTLESNMFNQNALTREKNYIMEYYITKFGVSSF